MLNKTILGKKKKNLKGRQVTRTEREKIRDSKKKKKKSHKLISTKVVTVWGLLSMSFNTSEFLSSQIKTSSFLFYSQPLLSPISKVIIRRFFAVFLFDFRTDMIYDHQTWLSDPMASPMFPVSSYLHHYLKSFLLRQERLRISIKVEGESDGKNMFY